VQESASDNETSARGEAAFEDMGVMDANDNGSQLQSKGGGYIYMRRTAG
jgi:hypothetical protein